MGGSFHTKLLKTLIFNGLTFRRQLHSPTLLLLRQLQRFVAHSGLHGVTAVLSSINLKFVHWLKLGYHTGLQVRARVQCPTCGLGLHDTPLAGEVRIGASSLIRELSPRRVCHEGGQHHVYFAGAPKMGVIYLERLIFNAQGGQLGQHLVPHSRKLDLEMQFVATCLCTFREQNQLLDVHVPKVDSGAHVFYSEPDTPCTTPVGVSERLEPVVTYVYYNTILDVYVVFQ